MNREITWTQDGVTRAGLVWDKTQIPATVYVIPDEVTEGESHVLVNIGKSRRAGFVRSVQRSEVQRLVRTADRVFSADAVVSAGHEEVLTPGLRPYVHRRIHRNDCAELGTTPYPVDRAEIIQQILGYAQGGARLCTACIVC